MDPPIFLVDSFCSLVAAAAAALYNMYEHGTTRVCVCGWVTLAIQLYGVPRVVLRCPFLLSLPWALLFFYGKFNAARVPETHIFFFFSLQFMSVQYPFFSHGSIIPPTLYIKHDHTRFIFTWMNDVKRVMLRMTTKGSAPKTVAMRSISYC